ncbi:MAG: zinc-ribbon domain-containing protein [Lachnospiraceae bacterium]
MFCEKCGQALPNDADFCPQCGTHLVKSPNHPDETDMFNVGQESMKDVPKESRKKSTLIVVIIAVLVGIILTAAIIVKVLGGSGAISNKLLAGKTPASNLIHSAQKTVFSKGASFDISGEVCGTPITGEGFFTADTKENRLEAYLSVYDMEFVITFDGEIFAMLQMEEDGYSDVDKVEIDEFHIDGEALFGLWKELGDKNIEKLDFDKWIDELGLDEVIDIDDYIETGDISKALEAVLKALDDNAEDCLGFEKDGDTCSFDINIYDALNVCIDALEPYVADEDVYDEICDMIKDNKSEINDFGNLEIEVKYDGECISEITVVMEAFNLNIEILLEDVNDCDKSLDSDYIDLIEDED